MRTLSVSAVLGLAAATGEWLAFRLRKHAVDQRLAEYLEAAWACATSVERSLTGMPAGFGARTDDPVQGVVAEYAALMRDAVSGAVELERFADSAESIVRLADHVIPGASYKSWRKSVIERLATVSGEFAYGPRFLQADQVRANSQWSVKTPAVEVWCPPVPREVFDFVPEPRAKSSKPA